MKKFYLIIMTLCVSYLINAQNIVLEAFGPNFDYPTHIKNAGDSRLFVTEQAGKIKILNTNGTVESTPFLDITSIVTDDISSNWESGLLGLVFHPNYASNGYFYVHYSNLDYEPVISRFKVSNSNPNIADPNSELIILELDATSGVHLGGELAFGSDGYLYMSIGDAGVGAGGAGDPDNMAQDLSRFYGKMLRIDVDNPANGKNYGIPPGNPFVETPTDDPNTLAEIWLYGFRNPAKFSFDSANGDLWIGDVGHEDIEEINLNAGNVGGLNYGWRCYEGTNTYNTSGGCPPAANLEFAAHEYEHFEPDFVFRCSVSAGYRYRGSAFPSLIGTYFAADWCSGEIFTITPDGSGGWDRVNHPTSFSSNRWVAFGEDINKELYVVSNPLDNTGQVYKVKQELLSTSSLSFEYDFSIIPNPSEDNVVTLNFNKATSLKEVNAINLQGQKIKAEIETINSTTAKIEFNNISSGVYIIETISNKGDKSQNKLIIK